MKTGFLCLLLCFVACPLFAGVVSGSEEFQFELSFDQSTHCAPPGPCDVGGTLDFYLLGMGNVNSLPLLLDSVSITDLSLGSDLIHNFVPPDPCFQENTCTFGFSFSGTAFESDGSDLTAMTFDVGSFPGSAPSDPPIVTGSGGPLVEFDGPETIGSWSASLMSVPEPASILLVAAGLAVIRRKHLVPRQN